jgi:hypothetical protein
VPSLFRRKPDEIAELLPAESPSDASEAKSRGYTPSKRELGKTTPKRPPASPRRGSEPPPANRREALKRTREKERSSRTEQRAGMMAGDERFLLARDRGPERALVRDVVDSRRTLGTWFFTFAIVLFVGTTFAQRLPSASLLVLNGVWALLGLAVIVDSYLICRKVGALVRSRFPKTTQRMGSLYIYSVMRAVTYRRMRVPRPRLKPGDSLPAA